MNSQDRIKIKIIDTLKTDDRLWNKEKTEMPDKKYGISKEDQKITEEFYGTE